MSQKKKSGHKVEVPDHELDKEKLKRIVDPVSTISNYDDLTPEDWDNMRKNVRRSQLSKAALKEIQEYANCGKFSASVRSLLEAATVSLEVSYASHVALLPAIHHRKTATLVDVHDFAAIRGIAVPTVDFTGGRNTVSTREQKPKPKTEAEEAETPPLSQPVRSESNAGAAAAARKKEKRKRSVSPAAATRSRTPVVGEGDEAEDLPSDVDRSEAEQAKLRAAKRARSTRSSKRSASVASDADE